MNNKKHHNKSWKLQEKKIYWDKFPVFKDTHVSHRYTQYWTEATEENWKRLCRKKTIRIFSVTNFDKTQLLQNRALKSVLSTGLLDAHWGAVSCSQCLAHFWYSKNRKILNNL